MTDSCLQATDFVGGLEVDNLNMSVVAMDFAHGPHSQADAHVTAPLTAKRAWFMLDQGFVALVANVSLTDTDESVSVGTSLSGSNSTILTILSWICAGIYMCGARPSPVCA